MPENTIEILVVGFIAFIFAGILLSTLPQMFCQDEKQALETCNINLNNCRQLNDLLNSSIQDCSNRIKEQADICDKRIANSTETYVTQIKIYQNYVLSVKVFFVIYNIILFLYIPLTINLLKITFKIKWGKKWEDTIGFWATLWLVSRAILWVFGFIILLALFANFLTNPV